MRITFLGGATAIGGSSAVLEIDGRRWVIDCGVRIRASGSERLPDFRPLEDLGAPTAILLTHAHLDHIGALPVLHQRFPLAAIHATPPTIELARIQLLDSLRIMAEEARGEGELPLYSPEAVESTLSRMVPVTPLRATSIDGGPEVTWFPAGHILGACSIGVAGREGRVLFSGDISVDNQRTIPGMKPPRFRADVVVAESTYGKRLHPSRAAEEERLVRTIAEVIEAGGKVLIPAFAIGRAQEVILVILREQVLGRTPKFPVHVDGMVRAVCAAYSRFPGWLQSSLRRRVEKRGDPFFGVLDNVRPVASPRERAAILSGPPCAIVASSGMLTGGASPVYARALADDPSSLIAITGYQDEESPGRRLLDVADGVRETLTLDGIEIRPRCRVTSYGLSAHASGQQIAAIVKGLLPRDVLLVHGEGSARRDLADLLLREKAGRIHLPIEGEPVELHGRTVSGPAAGRGPKSARFRAVGIGADSAIGAADGRAAAPGTEDLDRLAAHIRETYREGSAFTADELYEVWHGRAPADDEATRFEESLRRSSRFEPHPSRLFEFRAVEVPPPEEAPPFENVTTLLARLDAAIPADAGLLRKSYQPGVPHLLLVFAFPDTDGPRCRDAIAAVLEGTGWTWEVHPQTNPSALEAEARRSIPDPSLLVRGLSVRMEERKAAAVLARPLLPDEEEPWRAAALAFRDRTGFELELLVRSAAPAARVERDPEGRLEINLAYDAIRSAFASSPHAPYRVGKKTGAPGEDPWIEVAFISPEVGVRRRETLDELERHTGWKLRVATAPNQNAILETARALLVGVRVRRGPSFAPAERKVKVALDPAPSESEWARIAEAFQERTGWALDRG